MEVILRQFATPYCAKVLLPVPPPCAQVRVSVVIAIVTLLLDMFTKAITVPTGYATDAFAGRVNVRVLASDDGWKICLPASPSTVV